jgi:hypothetical protein
MIRPTMTPRKILPLEAEVILRALDKCPAAPVTPSLLATVTTLEVASRCECGCDTVNFIGWGQAGPPQILADGVADTPDGKAIGVIVFGTPNQITCLEVYSYDDEPARLPRVDSIRAYDAAA